MSSIEYIHQDGDDFITERDHRWSNGEFATEYGTIPYRHLHLSLADAQVTNDGTDTETVTISVVDGLDVARGDVPENATVLDHSGDVILFVDGQQTTKTLTNGKVEFDLTTDKPAGSEIEIVAESLADHPAESDSAIIKVVSA